MADVAARAGVSRALVSIVLRGAPGASPANRERVLRAAAELDYHPDHRARLLRSARTRTLGVVHALHRPFHAELVEALYGAVEGTGWRLALEPSVGSRPERAAVRALLDLRCEAVLLVGPALARADLAELAGRVPLVVMARSLRGVAADVVRTDDEAGARSAVEHLLSLGHERVAHLHGGRAPGAAERRRGVRAALAAAGLPVTLLPGGLTDADGVRAAPAVLAPGGPSAVLAFNDACAAGLLAAARAAGRDVPADLSVVGYDDSAVAALSTVALTTVGQDARALAHHAVARALARTEDAGLPPGEDVVAPRLVVRRTTAAPDGTGAR